jgi:hypothetical protein
MTTDNQQDLEAMAERVAEKAVETFALRMGLDPEDKDALKEFRENPRLRLAHEARGESNVRCHSQDLCRRRRDRVPLDAGPRLSGLDLSAENRRLIRQLVKW